MAEPEQRHPIYPSLVVSEPLDYPEPEAGSVNRLVLFTPDGQEVGTLLYSETGLSWSPTDTEDIDAQEHAAELLAYLRGNREQETPQDDVVAGIRDAYAGDMTEDTAQYVMAPGEQ